MPLKDNLLRVAFRITGNVERSEQIVQDVMLKVWGELTLAITSSFSL